MRGRGERRLESADRAVEGADRVRRRLLVAGIVLAVIGGLVALLAPGAPLIVPRSTGAAAGAPSLRYVRAFPEPDDPPFVRPVGVAVGNGRLYVADSGAGVIRAFSTAGPDAGEIGSDVLEVPAYVAYDVSSGTVLASDRAGGRVLRFDRGGDLLGEVRPSTEPTAAWEPLGIAIDDSGRIAVTDVSGRQRVVVMDADGTVLFEIGGSGGPEGAGPVGVALDYPNSAGFVGEDIWIGDSNNRRVLVFDRLGAFLGLVRLDGIARGLAFVEGADVGAGYVGVVDALASEIVLLDRQGAELARFGGAGSAPGRLAYPNDIEFEPGTDRLYVADTGNARVQVWEIVPAEAAEIESEPAEGPALSAMRLAGLIVLALGVVLAGAGMWPRREG